MAKEDLPPIGAVPKKRRQLEQAPDLWLATWLSRDDLTPSERRRVAEEKGSRRSGLLPVILGFTGTREGLTPKQRTRLRGRVDAHAPGHLVAAGVVEGHHGDCVNGDEWFHELCLELGIPVVLHPPEDGKLRAHCKGAARIEKAKPFLERNKDIVQVSTVLLAAPRENHEPPPARGQGTWSTVRYARHRGSEVEVVMPDGELMQGGGREG